MQGRRMKSAFGHSQSRVAQWIACWAHNPKVPESKPGSATTEAYGPILGGGGLARVNPARTSQAGPSAGVISEEVLSSAGGSTTQKLPGEGGREKRSPHTHQAAWGGGPRMQSEAKARSKTHLT